MTVIYYVNGDIVKGKFVGSDTTSLVFKAMTRVVRGAPDPVLEQSLKEYRASLPKPVDQDKVDYAMLKTLEKKQDFIAKKLGLL